MSSKAKPAVITIASILAAKASLATQREAIAKQEADLVAQESEVKRISMEKLGTVLDTFPTQIKAITGEDVTIAGVISYLKRRESGTLGSLANTPNAGNTAKRLTEAEDAAVKAAMFEREVNRGLGLPMEPISRICARFNVSGQSADVRKPKGDVELAALKTAIETRKAAMVPAAVPAAV